MIPTLSDLSLLARYPALFGKAQSLEPLSTSGGALPEAPAWLLEPQFAKAEAAYQRLRALEAAGGEARRAAWVLWVAHVRCHLTAPLRSGVQLDAAIYAAIGVAVGGVRLPPEPVELPARKGKAKSKGDRQGWLKLRAKAAERGAALYAEAKRVWEEDHHGV